MPKWVIYYAGINCLSEDSSVPAKGGNSRPFFIREPSNLLRGGCGRHLSTLGCLARELTAVQKRHRVPVSRTLISLEQMRSELGRPERVLDTGTRCLHRVPINSRAMLAPTDVRASALVEMYNSALILSEWNSPNDYSSYGGLSRHI